MEGNVWMEPNFPLGRDRRECSPKTKLFVKAPNLSALSASERKVWIRSFTRQLINTLDLGDTSKEGS